MLIRIVMVVLSLIGVLALFAGVAAFFNAPFAPQEQTGALLMLMGVASMGLAAVIAAILRVEQALLGPAQARVVPPGYQPMPMPPPMPGTNWPPQGQ